MKRVLLLLLFLVALGWPQTNGYPGDLLISCNAVTTTGACSLFFVGKGPAGSYT